MRSHAVPCSAMQRHVCGAMQLLPSNSKLQPAPLAQRPRTWYWHAPPGVVVPAEPHRTKDDWRTHTVSSVSSGWIWQDEPGRQKRHTCGRAQHAQHAQRDEHRARDGGTSALGAPPASTRCCCCCLLRAAAACMRPGAAPPAAAWCSPPLLASCCGAHVPAACPTEARRHLLPCVAAGSGPLPAKAAPVMLPRQPRAPAD